MNETTRKILLTLSVLVFPFVLLAVNSPESEKEYVDPTIVGTLKVVEPTPEPEAPKVWECKDCSLEEKQTLHFLQENGIVDKVAIATIMGNIKQESKFNANICEGGARVPYDRCYRGGYGLIQWTTARRYKGLGQFANQHSCDPSSINCQLKYMVTERQWMRAVSRFKVPNQSVSYYMKGAYWWLGWGVHGQRTKYSFQYVNRLSQG